MYVLTFTHAHNQKKEKAMAGSIAAMEYEISFVTCLNHVSINPFYASALGWSVQYVLAYDQLSNNQL